MLKDQTYIVGRERRQQQVTPNRERRSGNRSRRYIAIPHVTVSRRHAEIIVLNNRIYVRDLDSKNGTYLLSDGRKARLTEGYVDPEQMMFFGRCLRRIGKLLEDHQDGGGQHDSGASEEEGHGHDAR